MLDYTAKDAFTDTPIYDLSDLVKGGDLGVSNIPIKALLDRTLYLLNRLASFEGIADLTGDYTYDVADQRKLFAFTLYNNATFTLPDVTKLRPGTIIPINCYTIGIKSLTVQSVLGQNINRGSFAGIDTNVMYMHDNERLSLVAAGDHWNIINADGNFFTVGENVYSRQILKNSIATNGGIINRADMPRLSAYALSLLVGQGIVSDIQWNSDPIKYKGCFSQGNGTTTLRLPDERGMFIRAIDQGRGIDGDRLHNYVGGGELDDNKKHDHVMHGKGPIPTLNWFLTRTIGVPGEKRYSGSGGDIFGGDQNPDNTMRTGDTGASESRPKNIGLLNQIRY